MLSLQKEDDDFTQREEEDTRLKYETTLMDKGTSSIGNEGIDRAPTDKEESLNVQFTYMLEIGTTEVTQRLYRNVMGSNPVADEQDCHRWNPDVPPGPNMPVYCVSFKDAASFANKFSMAQGLDPCYVIDDMTENVRWPREPNVLVGDYLRKRNGKQVLYTREMVTMEILDLCWR